MDPLSRDFHSHQAWAEAGALLDDLDAARVTVPRFKDPPCVITPAQALTQAGLRSHQRRGHDAARLRELGGAPPLTDFIVWPWTGRPASQGT